MNDTEKTINSESRVPEKQAPIKKSGVNKNNKRFTALDFTVIVVIILCIVGIGFRTAIADLILKSAPEESITVKVKAENVSKDCLSFIQNEDVVYWEENALGVLESVSHRAATSVIEQKQEDGSVSFVTVEVKDAYTVYAEITLMGQYTESGFICMGNENLYVGKILNINTSLYQITVVITEIPRK